MPAQACVLQQPAPRLRQCNPAEVVAEQQVEAPGRAVVQLQVRVRVQVRALVQGVRMEVVVEELVAVSEEAELLRQASVREQPGSQG